VFPYVWCNQSQRYRFNRSALVMNSPLTNQQHNNKYLEVAIVGDPTRNVGIKHPPGKGVGKASQGGSKAQQAQSTQG